MCGLMWEGSTWWAVMAVRMPGCVGRLHWIICILYWYDCCMRKRRDAIPTCSVEICHCLKLGGNRYRVNNKARWWQVECIEGILEIRLCLIKGWLVTRWMERWIMSFQSGNLVQCHNLSYWRNIEIRLDWYKF